MLQQKATAFGELVASASVIFNDSVVQRIASALNSFDPTSLDEAEVGHLRKLLEIISTRASGTTALDLYHSAFQRYPQNTLTPIHHYIVRQCCILRTYDVAIPLLAQPIHHIPREAHLTYHDHLLYHFYGALCLIAVGQLKRALSCLKMVLGAGGRNTSRIQLEAYRKYLLINLIHTGKPAVMPKTVGLSTLRSLEILSAPYIEFQGVYLTNDTELHRLVEKYSTQYQNDGNLGLINSALASLAMHRIIDLQKVFITISLKDIGERIGLTQEAVQKTLNTMIETQKIHASIGSDGYVSFANCEVEEDEDVAKLQAQFQEATMLTKRMQVLQRSLELDPDYVAKFSTNDNSTRSSDRKGKGRGMMSPTTGNLSDDSEDAL